MIEEFMEYKKKMEYYQHMLALMEWDLRAKAPKGSMELKLETMKYFQEELFKLKTNPEYGKILQTLKKQGESTDIGAIGGIFSLNTDAMKLTIDRELDIFQRNSNIPVEFEVAYNQMLARSEKAWEEAKKANDFSIFAPWLEQNIKMTKERMGYMYPEKQAYDALLEKWQEGLHAEDIEKIFDEIKIGLKPILDTVKKQSKKTYACQHLTASPETMEKVQHFLLEYIGFDFNYGTTGDSPHALTSTIDEKDVRITNRLSGRNPIDICFSAIHEGGHGIYGQNVNEEYSQLAPHDLIYSDIHESQSRFYENILGRNISFWEPIYDELCKLWPELKDYSLQDMNAYMNRCEVSEIRTSADELTYCMHIILRYEMELMMFRDDIDVMKLPQIWNDKMEELLGVTPSDDAHGILQDMHWSSVFVGYFPTYLLGSVYDGMLLEAMEHDLGDVSELLSKKDMETINKWLHEKIHRHGSMYPAPVLLEKICGKKITPQPLIDYFMKKYQNT